jgi:hypothetical protein
MHMGYHSSPSFGATPYLVRGIKAKRKGKKNKKDLDSNDSDNGSEEVRYENIMIDVPRFNSKLADIVEEEGGVAKMIITHRDNMHDHEKWKARFPKLQRVIHR